MYNCILGVVMYNCILRVVMYNCISLAAQWDWDAVAVSARESRASELRTAEQLTMIVQKL
jgi:hypothetical protein